MFYLLISVVCNALLYVVIKFYPRFGVSTFNAIIFNYFTAGSLGYLNRNVVVSFTDSIHSDWFYMALALGCLFISIFVLIAKTTQLLGVSTASVANKMSVIIPVIAAIYLYNDHLSPTKLMGIMLALAAVYLTASGEKATPTNKKMILLPVIVFVGSGIIDAVVNYAQQKLLQESEHSIFISLAFFTAGGIGFAIMLINGLKTKTYFNYKDIVGGILLGIPNYLSIYFMVKALSAGFMESSAMLPVANMGVVALSAISGYFIFNEKISRINLAGIILSLIAIACIAL